MVTIKAKQSKARKNKENASSKQVVGASREPPLVITPLVDRPMDLAGLGGEEEAR